MKRTWILPALLGLLVLVLAGWLVRQTRWEEVEVDDPARGAAASDQDYALRKIVASAGATLEVRSTLEPMPPAGATLLLESSFWNIFPERDARLKAWVENGGQLVAGTGVNLRHRHRDLAWAPLSVMPRHAVARRASQPGAPAPEPDEVPPPAPPASGVILPGPPPAATTCANYVESIATKPAYEPGRVYRGCMAPADIYAVGGVTPTWELSMAPRTRSPFIPESRTLAVRVPVGRGSVTAASPFIASWNRGLLQGDNALIVAAVLQAAPGRTIWIVRDEAREPLLAWLWHEARAPFLLTLAAIALALWRLMVRFGPREAVPPRARRSMGEQVRGTGHFIAGTDPRALHAATRQAFEAVAQRRVEGWAELDEAARIEALAASTPAIARAALQASMHIGGGATPAQILAAIAVLEQARRALLRGAATPPSH